MGQAKPFSSDVVLVVEDEPLQRMMAVDLVESIGFEALEATSAGDAVRILESRPDIHIVFTDVDIPGGINGIQLAAAIRDRWPPIEIIIVSGKRTLGSEDLPARGVFFSKPYRRDEVAATMRKMRNF